jgi:hypothetical protein
LCCSGASIKGDLTRLEKHYENVIGSDINILDLVEVAISRGYTLKSKSLEMLTRQFCQRNLSKDPKVRLSNWTLGKKLSKEQIHYAALDAYASCLAYMNIVSKRDPRTQPILNSLLPGTKVLLFTKSDAECVAQGTAVQFSGEKWGALQLKTKKTQRVVICIDHVLNSSANALYCQLTEKKIKALGDLLSQQVLWDLAHIRIETAESLAWMESVLLETDTTINSHDSEFVGVDEVHLMTPPELATVDGSADERNEDDDSISETGSECESLCDSDSSDDDIFDDARTDTFQVKVRLDCFHAMNRINRTLLKAHGAYKPFMARLRDAIFLISAEDMNTVVAALKAARWTDEQIQAKKKYDWGFFLKHCRRHIPHKEELLKRFDKVCDAFHDMLDSKTQKPLFRAKTTKEVKNLRQHIANGCLSDVPDFPLYCLDGRTEEGLPIHRCARGTNSNEGYHKHMRKVLHQYASSPKLLHLLLLEFNFRWNVRMAVKNRGLNLECGSFYSQFVLEEINYNASGLCNQAPYSSWKSPMDYEDTLERFGLRKSILLGDSELNFHTIPEALTDATKSQRDFSELLGYKNVGTFPVSSHLEKNKFEAELSRWMSAPRSRNGEIDFDGWAYEWTTLVTSMENGDVEFVTGLRRKTAKHLKDYYNERRDKANTSNTLAASAALVSQLRIELQQPSLQQIPLVTQSLDEISTVASESSWVSISHSTLDSYVMPLASTLTTQSISVQDQLNPPSIPEAAERTSKRAGRMLSCSKCGHTLVKWPTFHLSKGACTVPQEQYSTFYSKPGDVCREKGRKKGVNVGHSHGCKCERCLV